MSPEQIQNVRKTDHRADIWSVGVILYELMSGVLPFRGETPGEIFVRIIEGHATPLAKLRKDIPAPLSEIVEKCLKRNVDERFDSVVSLAEALAPYAWYKHHESLARMRRTVGHRGHRSIPPGTSSNSVPAAVRVDTSNRTTAGSGSGGASIETRVLLGLAAAIPLAIIPLAAFVVMHRSSSESAPPQPAETVQVAATVAATTASAASAATASATTTQPAEPPPPPPEATSAAPEPSGAPPSASAADGASTLTTPTPSAAPSETSAHSPATAGSPGATRQHAPPSKRSILQQRY
jgi:serine/threonine-protein kinase